MVTKRELKKQIELLEIAQASMQNKYNLLLNSLKAMNKKLNTHIKGEKAEQEEDSKVNDWLTDDRIDEIQDFLHKGVK